METRVPHWRAFVLPVAFALACVALTIAAWVSFGGRVPLSAQGYRFYLPLPQAGTIYPDTTVRIAGITVGRVISVRRAAGGARALIEMEPAYVPVRRGARAIVRSKTLLGEGYIELAPGPASAPALPDGGVLPASGVASQQQLFDVLRIYDPVTRARIRAMFSGLAASIRGQSQSLNDAVAYAAPVSANFADVFSALAGQERSLSSLIGDTGTVLSALGSQQGVVEAVVRQGSAALGATARSERGLAATIAALPPFLAQTRATSETVGGATGELSAAVGALDGTAGLLAPALRSVEAATPVFTSLFSGLGPVLSAGERGLPALQRILAAASPGLRATYAAARQLIPFLALMSADRNSVYGSLANAAQIQNGVMEAPRVGPVHYAAGAVTVWNETIGGWVRKLPTNRSNPYPAPDSEIDIAHGGLRAYDCRNTGNPLLVPPTGNGAPPCLLQGPWTFLGRRADYPRLQPAPP